MMLFYSIHIFFSVLVFILFLVFVCMFFFFFFKQKTAYEMRISDWSSDVCSSDLVLRRGGVLYLSTSNVLCPRQAEFNIPAYSWFPPFMKRHVVRLASSSRPELANYATYPALHWFSYYGLRDFLARRGFRTLDRFDIAMMKDQPAWRRLVLELICHVTPLRFLGHVASPGLILMAIKHGASSEEHTSELQSI